MKSKEIVILNKIILKIELPTSSTLTNNQRNFKSQDVNICKIEKNDSRNYEGLILDT